MAKWTVKNKYGDFNAISSKFGISPVTARLLVNRGVESANDIESYLNGTLNDLNDPFDLYGMDVAVDIILDAIECEKKIRIIGDYDIDGVTSTYILTKGLRALGANVTSDIPDRTTDGYGLNKRLVDKCINEGIELIITVDNGIAAVDSIKLAREAGIDVVVTDHHQLQDEIPIANVIIDPHQPSDNSKYKTICGGFVAFKLVQALYRSVGIDESEELKLIPYAAIATIGDIMPLTGENRILVKEGLKLIPNCDSIGLKELINIQGIADQTLTVYHVGFIIGPCINASGRLDTAKKALELLECEDLETAKTLAGDLKALNEWRKGMTIKWSDTAIDMINNAPVPRVIVAYLPECHESLAGIVAGRIKEHFNHPTFVITKTEEGLKGSGRSIEAYNMFEEMNKIKDLFTKFGGHPMAAGLSLNESNLDEFINKINENCTLKAEDFEETVKLDMQLPFDYISEELINDIARLAPYGTENSSPLFGENKVNVMYPKAMGKNNNVVKMTLEKHGIRVEGIYFGDASEFLTILENKKASGAPYPQLTIAYMPEINEYKGNKKMQVKIKAYM